MTNPSNYRNQAQAVRSSARESLMQLREERMAKRRELAASRDNSGGVRALHHIGQEADFQANGPDLTIPDGPGPRSAPEPAPIDAAGPEEMMVAAPDTVAEPEIDDMSDAEEVAAYLADTVADEIPDAQPLCDAGPQVQETHHDELAVPADDHIDMSLDTVVETDLARLPGAGIGLVWMLQQCDVQTLADLAEQDADILSEKLGVVGQILNVQAWIDFARTESAT